MAKTISAIQALISNKISSITDIKFVSNYGDGNFSAYPAAVIIPTGGIGKVADTAVHERIFNFEVLLYQEQSLQATSKEDAELKMVQVCDQIIQEFDQDQDLGKEVMRVEVVDYTFDFKAQSGTWNFATFRVNAVVLVNH